MNPSVIVVFGSVLSFALVCVGLKLSDYDESAGLALVGCGFFSFLFAALWIVSAL